ncbi:MAG: hypothetical protein H6R14_455 [Proteobacteria bacterium]|nr:hypothetical protein [Pseudomonadota bacterium]
MFKKSILLATMLGLASIANAASFNLDVSSSDWWEIDGSERNFKFTAPVADANAKFSFVLQGFNTVDGANGYADQFSFQLNDIEIAGGLFDLGGGGFNIKFGGSSTSSLIAIDTPNKTVTFSNLPINLLEGTNMFTFKYTPLSGSSQGLADEAWKLNSATITAAVPEPESYAMLLAGLGLMGAMARRRKN